MSNELKPCPFCGGEAVIYQNYDEYGYWSISCDACHVEMISGVRAILVSAWNTRPTVDAKPADRKQITEILHDISADNARMSRVYGVVREKNKKLTSEVERLKGVIAEIAAILATGADLPEDDVFTMCKDAIGEKAILDRYNKKLRERVSKLAPATNAGSAEESR